MLGSVLFADAAATDRARWFRQLLAALAQPRRPDQRRAVVKLDAWAILALPSCEPPALARLSSSSTVTRLKSSSPTSVTGAST